MYSIRRQKPTMRMNSDHKTAVKRVKNRDLTRPANSIWGRVRRRIVHRAAIRQFEAVRKISTQTAEEVFPGIGQVDAKIRCAVQPQASWANLAPNELIILSTVCAAMQPKCIFEFGTFDGLTTLHLALNSRADAKIYTIDLPPDDPIRAVETADTYYTRGIRVGRYFVNTLEAGRIQQLFQNSRALDTTSLKNQVDLIF